MWVLLGGLIFTAAIVLARASGSWSFSLRKRDEKTPEDEGHGFARPENRLAFFAVAEAFLAECLGGRFDPVGDDFEGSTITVPSGAEHVPKLPESLKD